MTAQADRPCSVLAYGDVKRVELAIAMANAPKLLLMDEPTAGMAPKERNELMALTKQLVHRPRHGGAVHRAQHGRGVRLRRPHDRAGARPADRRRASRWRSATIRRCRRCTSAAARPSRRSPRRPLRHAASRAHESHECCSKPRPCAPGTARRRSCSTSTCEVRRGEVVALMGRNGAGKSTTLKALIGMLAKRRGAVRFLGHDISQERAARRGARWAWASCPRTGACSPTSR